MSDREKDDIDSRKNNSTGQAYSGVYSVARDKAGHSRKLLSEAENRLRNAHLANKNQNPSEVGNISGNVLEKYPIIKDVVDELGDIKSKLKRAAERFDIPTERLLDVLIGADPKIEFRVASVKPKTRMLNIYLAPEQAEIVESVSKHTLTTEWILSLVEKRFQKKDIGFQPKKLPKSPLSRDQKKRYLLQVPEDILQWLELVSAECTGVKPPSIITQILAVEIPEKYSIFDELRP